MKPSSARLFQNNEESYGTGFPLTPSVVVVTVVLMTIVLSCDNCAIGSRPWVRGDAYAQTPLIAARAARPNLIPRRRRFSARRCAA